MKRAFTMIELIFVIVILGILAFVAIPRLAATRDDAEIAKAAQNLTTLITDISAYYTSQGHFSEKLNVMTNVEIDNPKTTGSINSKNLELTGNIKLIDKKCISFLIKDEQSSSSLEMPAYMQVKEGKDSQAGICKKFLALNSVKQLMGDKVIGRELINGEWKPKELKGAYQIKGIGVKF